MSDQRPIGIFDSGVGGLTVASAIAKHLPQESFIYFGDSRHAPYGDKSKSTIIEYSRRIANFLVEQNCKAIVIACNSASAAAFNALCQDFPDLPILNVVDPTVNALVEMNASKVGIIATRATTRSAVYTHKIKALDPNLEVAQKATPLLAPLVEEGFAGTSVSKGALDHYLSHSSLKNLSHLVLGCTHYPLLKSEVENYFGSEVAVLDSAHLVALALEKLLEERGLLKANGSAQQAFYVSEKTAAFTKVAKLFFGGEIQLKEKVLSA